MTILSSTELDTGLEAELLATATIITLGGHWGTHGTDEKDPGRRGCVAQGNRELRITWKNCLSES